MLVVVLMAVGAGSCAAMFTGKGENAATAETERPVAEAEVPEAALATLRKLAAGAEISEFAEECEGGYVFYEGSWETASGVRMDVLVSHTGALIEIEESVKAEQAPTAVRETALESAGENVSLAFEKKTTILYEVKFEDADGLYELLLTPDGRCVEEVGKGKADDAEDREDEEEGNDG